MTFIAGLRLDRISAPWIIDGPINGELFTIYVEQVLAPTLAKGDIVVLDNLGSHKGKAARNFIRAALTLFRQRAVRSGNVAFGSIASLSRYQPHVRFALNTRHSFDSSAR